ncbi:sensor histidine kinase [Cryptosporangium sp. NPDC048952]|uniref:sensor histidine kinase n=1 Tax=Cryptosporangium sp. NPDC048952 TaxID=3363961 RepID=UPI00371F7BC3
MSMRAVLPVPGHTGRAALVGVGVGVLTFLCGVPYWCEHLTSAAIAVPAAGVFGAAGGLLLGTGDSRQRSGQLLLVGAVFGAFAWSAIWDSGIWPTFAFYCEGVSLIVSGAAVLAYPAGRLVDRADRCWVYAAIGVLIVGELLVELVSHPEWNDLSPDVFWPTLVANRPAFDAGIATVTGLQVVLAAWYLVLLVRRGRALSSTERPAAIPVLIGTGIAAAAIAATARTRTFTDLESLLSLYVVQNTISAVLALAVLSGALRERWREVDAPHRVVRMTSSTTSVATVRDALAAALRDPPLRLLFWIPAERSYVDRRGRLVLDPSATAGRWLAEARMDDRQPLALVELDDGLRLRKGMVDAVLRAGSQALLTAQLQAVATTQLEQVFAAQARVEERETAERQRLEKDLRDGAQRQLAALAERLSRLDALPQPARSVVASCHDEVLGTIEDLEALARGLHPTVLRTDGLGAALDEVAVRLGLAVQLAVDAGRKPPAVEATAYFALCEGLTNVAKYAPEARVRIEVTEADGWLHGLVADDGPGGARVVPGGGLAGIDDRIRALHGRTLVESRAGAGTRLRVSLPCG